MLIQYFSDLHLEFYKKFDFNSIDVKAPNLVLAGDIGHPHEPIYEEFFQNMSQKFEKIFYVAGNHTYYNRQKTIEETNMYIKTILDKFPNITFLNNSYEYYKGYCFIGTTLWSLISNNKYLTNDFYRIKDMDINKYNTLHLQSIDFITEQLDLNNHHKIIMITHHLPSFSLIHPKYKCFEKYQQCFSSNNDKLIKNPIICWIYGHTHMSSIHKINNIDLYCNPIGYPDENKIISFEKIIKC